MSKIALPFVVVFTFVYAYSQCAQDVSGLLERVTVSSFQSLESLHDYVWIVEEHATTRDGKGKIQTTVHRQQNVIANGKMYRRILKPGEEPALPESEAELSADYQVTPFDCDGRPCLQLFPFWLAISLRDFWNVRQVKEGELQGKKMVVIDIQAKNLPHPGYGPISGTAWVDPERCRLQRLQITSALPNGHDQSQEVLEFGDVKGNWLPVKDTHGKNNGHIIEWSQEYTYLKFGSSTRVVP